MVNQINQNKIQTFYCKVEVRLIFFSFINLIRQTMSDWCMYDFIVLITFFSNRLGSKKKE